MDGLQFHKLNEKSENTVLFVPSNHINILVNNLVQPSPLCILYFMN